jgi:hypothetical protein
MILSRIHLAWLCFVLGAAHCGGEPRANKAAPKSSTGMGKMQNDVFGMDNRDYFTDPGKNFSEVGYRLADAGKQGLLLGGPDYVAYDKDARFPVSCLNVAERLELRDYDLQSYGIITAVNVATGDYYADHLIEQKFKKEKMDPNASLPPAGISFRGTAGDLFARLEIPRHTAEYLVTGILLNRVSNRVKIRVGSEAARENAARFAAEAENGAKAPAPQHRPLPTRRVGRESGSPVLPDIPGINAAIAAPPKKPFTSADRLDLYVAYRLPLPPVRPGGKPATELSFHILATGTRVPTPMVMQATVPILPANQAADGTVQGFLSLDVNQGNNFEGNQTYSVYLFSGEQLGAVPKVELP